MANNFKRVVHNTYSPPKKTVDERQLEVIEKLIKVQNLGPFAENDAPSGSDNEKRDLSDGTASVE
jgi:hypothetical protein